MKRLDELIAELCPDGVEYKPLGEVCVIDKGCQLNRDTLFETGKYPVVNGGIEPSGYWDKSNFKSNSITISQGGASAGYVNWMKVDFWAGAHCFVLKNISETRTCYRYIYYVVKGHEYELMKSQVGAGIPSVGKERLSKISIPLPSLAIQKEIVRILDGFTGLIDELEAELVARQKQYEQYREKLLAFGDGVEWKKLGDVCVILDSERKPVSQKNRVNGQYPYYGANGIQDYVDGFIFDGIYLLVGEDGSVITANGNPILTWAEGRIWVNNHAHVLKEIRDTKLRYLYHYLHTADISKFVRGMPPKLNQENLVKIDVPVPPIAEQRRIVKILDKFDALCNDETAGLRAEIAARRKQYEYYRERLLTFKKKAS